MTTDGEFHGDRSGSPRAAGASSAGGDVDGDPSQGPDLPPPVVPPPFLPPREVRGAPSPSSGTLATVSTVATPGSALVLGSGHAANVGAAAFRSSHAADGGWTLEGMQEVHRRTTEQMRDGRRGPRRRWPARVVRLGIAVVTLASIVGGLFVVSRINAALSTPDVPVFDAVRPPYGTVTVTGEGQDGAGHYSFEATTNEDGTAFSLAGTFDGEAYDVVGTPDGTFLRTARGSWVRLDGVQDADVRRYLDRTHDAVGGIRVPIYTDFVPMAARPYVEVSDERDVVLDGRPLRRIELIVDVADFQRFNAPAFQRWAAWLDADVTDPAVDHVRLVLTVDPSGVVWRLESWSDVSDARMVEDLVGWDDADYVPEVPTTYQVFPPDSDVDIDV